MTTRFRLHLTLACEQQGKLDEAETAHRQALALAPQNPEPANNLAWFLAEHHRNLDEARAVERAAQLPDVAEIPERLRQVRERSGVTP